MEKELEKILKECMTYFGKENGYGKDDLSNLNGYVEEFISEKNIHNLCDRLKTVRVVTKHKIINEELNINVTNDFIEKYVKILNSKVDMEMYKTNGNGFVPTSEQEKFWQLRDLINKYFKIYDNFGTLNE